MNNSIKLAALLVALSPAFLVAEDAKPSASKAEAPAQAETTAKAETPKKEEAPKAKPAETKADPFKAPADVAKAPEDAEKTASGLASKVLTPGTGKVKPKASDTVTVHYTGWTTDGRMFDSSYKRGTPASFPLTHVIKGWTEGVQLMVEGEKRRFWIPEKLAYQGQRAPYGMLVFDVELIKIEKK